MVGEPGVVDPPREVPPHHGFLPELGVPPEGEAGQEQVERERSRDLKARELLGAPRRGVPIGGEPQRVERVRRHHEVSSARRERPAAVLDPPAYRSPLRDGGMRRRLCGIRGELGQRSRLACPLPRRSRKGIRWDAGGHPEGNPEGAVLHLPEEGEAGDGSRPKASVPVLDRPPLVPLLALDPRAHAPERRNARASPGRTERQRPTRVLLGACTPHRPTSAPEPRRGGPRLGFGYRCLREGPVGLTSSGPRLQCLRRVRSAGGRDRPAARAPRCSGPSRLGPIARGREAPTALPDVSSSSFGAPTRVRIAPPGKGCGEARRRSRPQVPSDPVPGYRSGPA